MAAIAIPASLLNLSVIFYFKILIWQNMYKLADTENLGPSP